jgi:hypothetical protein
MPIPASGNASQSRRFGARRRRIGDELRDLALGQRPVERIQYPSNAGAKSLHAARAPKNRRAGRAII